MKIATIITESAAHLKHDGWGQDWCEIGGASGELIEEAAAKLRAMQELMPEIKNILSFISWEDTTTKEQSRRIHSLLTQLERLENE